MPAFGGSIDDLKTKMTVRQIGRGKVRAISLPVESIRKVCLLVFLPARGRIGDKHPEYSGRLLSHAAVETAVQVRPSYHIP